MSIMTNASDGRKWTLVGNSTGTTPVSIDVSTYKEFLVVVGWGTITMDFHVLADELSSTPLQRRGGYYQVAGTTEGYALSCSNTQFELVSVYVNSGDQTASATMTVYAK